MLPLFATGVIDTDGKFTPGVVDTVPLLPVLTTPAVPVAKFISGVIDTSGNFATGVVNTGGKLENLLPMSLIPVHRGVP